MLYPLTIINPHGFYLHGNYNLFESTFLFQHFSQLEAPNILCSNMRLPKMVMIDRRQYHISQVKSKRIPPLSIHKATAVILSSLPSALACSMKTK